MVVGGNGLNCRIWTEMMRFVSIRNDANQASSNDDPTRRLIVACCVVLLLQFHLVE